MQRLPEGLWPVMITSFKSNNQLDLDGMKKITDMYLAAGANGMFANCLSSEMFQLNTEERLTLVKTVVDHCKGKVPVVATGSFHRNPTENVEFIKKIYDLGVEAVILISSVLVEPEEPEEKLKQRIDAILEAAPNIPLGLYECPMPYKRVVSPTLMKWLAGTGRFWYHKDTTCDALAIKSKLAQIADSDFHLYNADTPSALQSLRFGAKGISPISGNFYPELYGHYLKLYRENKTEELEALNGYLVVMDRITHDFYPRSAKLFLQKRGLGIDAATRTPSGKMSVKDQNIHQGLFKMFELVREKFSIDSVIE